MKVIIGSNEAGQRIDKFLRKWLKDVPLSAIYKNIRKGDVKVNGKKVKEKYFLSEGDIVEIFEIKSDGNRNKFKRVENNLKILYEDSDILLVEKWPGVLVHSGINNDEPSLTDYVLSYLYDKGDYDPSGEISFVPAPCNRLDRNTSGIVIFGKSYEGLKRMNEMIRERKVKKFYLALVKGRIADGYYEAYISKMGDSNISNVFAKEQPGTKKIAMNVKTIESCGTYSLLELELLTGRSHQLRAHLSYLGNPIIGDAKYGDKKLNSYFVNKYGLTYQFLYAHKLIFDKKTITVALPPILKKIKTDIFRF